MYIYIGMCLFYVLLDCVSIDVYIIIDMEAITLYKVKVITTCMHISTCVQTQVKLG